MFLEEKSEWNGKLENRLGLKKTQQWTFGLKKESNDNFKFQILTMF